MRIFFIIGFFMTAKPDKQSRIDPREKYLLILILAVAALLRAWQIDWSLPDIYEEATPFRIAWSYWNWGGSGFDFNPHFFHYPALSFHLQFLVQLVHYGVGFLTGAFPDTASYHQAFEANPTSFFLQARLLSVSFDLGTILLTFLLGRKLLASRMALLPAAIVAVSPLHISNSRLIAVDAQLAFFFVLSLFFVLKLLDSENRKTYLLAGLFIGLAAATKYTGALLLGVLTLSHVLRLRSKKMLPGTHVSLFLAVIVSALTFLVLNPFIFTDREVFLNDFSYEQHHMSEGHLGIDSAESSVLYYLLSVVPFGFGWAVLPLFCIGLLTVFSSRRPDTICVMASSVFYLAMISSWEMRAERYLLPIGPMIALLAVVGLAFVWDEVLRRIPSFPRVIPLIISMFVLVPMAIGTVQYHQSFALPDTRTLVRNWMVENVARGAAIAAGPIGIELTKPGYRVVPIPFAAVSSEVMGPFYDTRWYEDLDLVVASDHDYGRYMREPERFRNILPFFDSLRSGWNLVHEVAPADGQQGPTIWLYAPRRTSASRFSDEMMARLSEVPDTALVAYFLEKLARPLFEDGHNEKSEQLMREAISKTPHNGRLRTAFAYLLFREGKFDQALGEIGAGLTMNPDHAELIALRGSTLLRMRRFDEAEHDLLSALTLNKSLEIAYLDLELLYRHRNETAKRISILERYVEILPPDSENARRATALIRELKATP